MTSPSFDILDIKITERENDAIAGPILSGLRSYCAPYLGSDTLEPFSIYMLDSSSNLIAGITGAIRQYPRTKTAWVHKVWVQEAYRGRGLGANSSPILSILPTKKSARRFN